MILFTAELKQKILSGEKTQTRRMWKHQRVKPGKTYWAQTNLFPNSRFARLKIVSVYTWDGIGHEISLEDARKEGFQTIDDFARAWYSLNETRLADPDRTPYVVNFEVIPIKLATNLGDSIND